MYVCAFRSQGEPLHGGDVFGPIARLRRRSDRTPTTVATARFLAVASETGSLRPLAAKFRDHSAVGDVRLDNRAELVRLCGGAPANASDLEVVLRLLDTYGEQAIPRILGDFAFVAWDARAQRLLAVRDAFGVKPLYFSRSRGTVFFASRMDLLASGADYDLDHIADLLAGMTLPEDRTIWAGVRPVPAGAYMVQRGTVCEGRRYWSADRFQPASHADARGAVEEFHALFRDAVQQRLGAPMSTWAQLSGGLDSSAVVGTAQNLYGGERLGGTLTVVDTLGGGDERRYSDVVATQFGLRNEQVRDFWAWQDDGSVPPVTEAPHPLYPFFARDRRVLDVVRQAGGRVLLSGFGSDHYLMGNLGYVADMLARGRARAALSEALRWSVARRGSFWGTLRQEVLRPFVPARWRGHDRRHSVPAWIDSRFAASTAIEQRVTYGLANDDRPGELFARKVARDVQSVSAWVDRWPFDDGIEMRYPFLYRPLVEAGLRLPPTLRIRPDSTKWVLREAMRGTLPEDVRTRSSKGTIDARILWSLRQERRRIDALLRDPMLAQLGCIDPQPLRDAVEAARNGVVTNLVYLMSALGLETWLSVRSGRWAPPAVAATAA